MAKIEFFRNNTLRVELDLDTDTTGATVFFMATSSLTDPDNQAVMSAETDSHDDAAAGLTHFVFGPPVDDQTNLEPGKYFYDIKVVYADGTEESWPNQKIKVKAVVKQGSS